MKISPSMLACNFAEMGKEILKVTDAKADLIHMDVMDGHFVPNISFGADIINSLRPLTHLPFDVHLMISKPDEYIDVFSMCGANILTFHVESASDPFLTIKKICRFGIRPGISLKPRTDIIKILPFLPFVDVVLVMTVEPGFGGQKFINSQVSKIKKLREIIDKNNFKCLIEVDGGINVDTAAIAKSAGADICVAGTSIFKSRDIAKTIQSMR